MLHVLKFQEYQKESGTAQTVERAEEDDSLFVANYNCLVL